MLWDIRVRSECDFTLPLFVVTRAMVYRNGPETVKIASFDYLPTIGFTYAGSCKSHDKTVKIDREMDAHPR